MSEVHEILVSFDPLKIELPGAGPFVGEIRIVLPEVHFKLHDLSMGGIIPDGPYIGGDARLWGFTFAMDEPGMEAGALLTFIASVEEQLKEMHRLIQEAMYEKFLLDR